MKIACTLFTVGKKSPTWIEEGITLYTKRMEHSCTFAWVYCKDNRALLTALAEWKHPLFLLEEKGRSVDTAAFAQLLLTTREKGSRFIGFVIGESEGIPAVLQKSYPSLSLSPLTFPHQFVRLLLVEQIYRSLLLLSGHPYPK